MSVVDSFLKKMRMVNDEEEDFDDDDFDYDEDYDDYDDDDEIYSGKPVKEEKKKTPAPEPEKEYQEPVKKPAAAPAAKAPAYTPNSNVVGMNRSSSEIVGCRPESFEEAHVISDILLSGKGVFLNLEGIDMAQAQRIVDFAAGACYTVGGTLQRANNKIFIITPPGISLSGEFTELQAAFGDESNILQ